MNANANSIRFWSHRWNARLVKSKRLIKFIKCSLKLLQSIMSYSRWDCVSAHLTVSQGLFTFPLHRNTSNWPNQSRNWSCIGPANPAGDPGPFLLDWPSQTARACWLTEGLFSLPASPSMPAHCTVTVAIRGELSRWLTHRKWPFPCWLCLLFAI